MLHEHRILSLRGSGAPQRQVGVAGYRRAARPDPVQMMMLSLWLDMWFDDGFGEHIPVAVHE